MKIFNWIATLWRGTVEWSTALLFCVGGIATFAMGGITGIFVAVFPIDWQLTDTYFVVAHFHYTAFGAAAFGDVRRALLLVSQDERRMLSETLGKLSFALVFVGFHLTFLIQHSAGLPACRGASTSTPSRLDGLQPHLHDRLVRARASECW